MRQQHQFVFETFKHFATLNTAAAPVVVALYRYLDLKTGTVIVPLIIFGVSLVLCAWGMLSIALEGPSNNEKQSGTVATLLCVVVFFLLGLYWSLYYIVFS